MSGNTKGTLELIRVLNNSVHALGVWKVIHYLKWITTNSNDKKNIADMVVFAVCEKYNTTPSELLDSERTDGDMNDAICIMAFLLKKHALLNQNQIAEKLKRHKSQVSKYMSRMAKLDNRLKQDFKVFSYCEDIDNAIKTISQKQQDSWMEKEVAEDQEKQI
jgi:hypothetical protein